MGRDVAGSRERGEAVGLVTRAQFAVADPLVLAKVRERFGGKIRFLICGSAPLDADVARWFAAFGLTVCEGYGLTETSAFTTVNLPEPGRHVFGSIGRPAPGTEITTAADCEILVKGPGVRRAYHGNPAATAIVFTEDGRFCTGDIGEIDERGFIRITGAHEGRLQDLRRQVRRPGRDRGARQGLCPYVSQFVVVVGDGHNYVSALVTLDAEAITSWAAEQGLDGRGYAEIVTSPQARDLVQGYVDELNRGQTGGRRSNASPSSTVI